MEGYLAGGVPILVDNTELEATPVTSVADWIGASIFLSGSWFTYEDLALAIDETGRLGIADFELRSEDGQLFTMKYAGAQCNTGCTLMMDFDCLCAFNDPDSDSCGFDDPPCNLTCQEGVVVKTCALMEVNRFCFAGECTIAAGCKCCGVFEDQVLTACDCQDQ